VRDGDLDKMLIKVADNYDSDVDVLVGSLISILEPVMVVVLGSLSDSSSSRCSCRCGFDRNDFVAEIDQTSCELRIASCA